MNNLCSMKPPVDNSIKSRSDGPKPNPCPCCGCGDIKVFFESIESNGVVTGYYLSHPMFKEGTSPLEAWGCEVRSLNLYEWYSTKEEAILAWNSGEAIANARKFKEAEV
ncbi:hypothetical protein [Sulfitobacter sp. R18_1]|uniref:hypothetical protein n=1 Tax=Sulfitobacter sp. R18_1 TaxID=2821104 RepID=UPI001ADAA450|nr:hypothetical protein [Sulfitobacter sp. R18_1]MBO9428841.1 hypothetical protein [Sulfitobacter sp. R18_1]